jgi:hypothetical protein
MVDAQDFDYEPMEDQTIFHLWLHFKSIDKLIIDV